MTLPPDRARLLDAEMQLQRAWLELNLRELSATTRKSPWAKLHALKIGLAGLSVLKHRSLWVAALSLVMNLYRRRGQKDKT
jgi:hypothetical protein